MKRGFTWLVAALIVVLGSASSEASLMLRLENVSLSKGVVIGDNSFLDLNPDFGVITYSGKISGGFTVNVTTTISKPVLSGAQLDLNSVNVQTTGAGWLRISAEDTDYSYGVPEYPRLWVNAAVGGTLVAGTSATFQSWVDPWNAVPNYGPITLAEGAVPAIVVPGTSLPVWDMPGFAAAYNPVTLGAFSSSASIPFDQHGEYALFAQADLVFTGSGTKIISFNELQDVVVPEPASLIVWSLLGAAGMGLSVWRRGRGGRFMGGAVPRAAWSEENRQAIRRIIARRARR
ncbi:MAG: hypothetical protein NTW96_01520 [Planctomycetia bacterium]|nr:hypothetical protein [Planctomycetia bacterium]